MEDSPSHVDTSEGFHRLSDYFGYEFEGMPTRKWTISFFHIEDGGTPPGQLIGQTRWDVGGNSSLDISRFFVDPSCSRPALYAIDSDGTTLLYSHDLPVDAKRGPLGDKSDGVYRLVHAVSGGAHLHELLTERSGISDWPDLPEDQMAVRVDGGTHKESTPFCGIPIRGLYGDIMIVGTDAKAIPAWLVGAPELYRATFHEDLEALDASLEMSANVNGRYLGLTPLHLSAMYGRDPAVFRRLLTAGSDPNAAFVPHEDAEYPAMKDDTATPLSILLDVASDERSRTFVPAALEALFEFNVDLQAKSEDYDGRSKLWSLAMKAGRPIGIAEVLQRHDIELSPERASTLLHGLANQLKWDDEEGEWIADHLKKPRLLVMAGADINHRDESGQTPLFHTHNRRMIEALVELGADPNIEDEEGRRASLEPMDY